MLLCATWEGEFEGAFSVLVPVGGWGFEFLPACQRPPVLQGVSSFSDCLSALQKGRTATRCIRAVSLEPIAGVCAFGRAQPVERDAIHTAPCAVVQSSVRFSLHRLRGHRRDVMSRSRTDPVGDDN